MNETWFEKLQPERGSVQETCSDAERRNENPAVFGVGGRISLREMVRFAQHNMKE